MVLLVVPELQNIHFVSEGSVSVPSKGSYPDRVLNQETTGLFQEGASFIPAIRDVELLPWRVLQCLMCFFFFPQVTLPTAQVPRASAIPLPRPPPPPEPLQLQFLPISKPPKLCPITYSPSNSVLSLF